MRRLIPTLVLAFPLLLACQMQPQDRRRAQPKTAQMERSLNGTSPKGSAKSRAESAFGNKLAQIEKKRAAAPTTVAPAMAALDKRNLAGRPMAGNLDALRDKSNKPGDGTNITKGPPRQTLDNVRVVAYGKDVHSGAVDLRPTIARILRGESHSHKNDGRTFGNYEKRLPDKGSNYYREYVHPTKGINGAGPQRLVVGKGGEWYYTGDHYETFTPLQ